MAIGSRLWLRFASLNAGRGACSALGLQSVRLRLLCGFVGHQGRDVYVLRGTVIFIEIKRVQLYKRLHLRLLVCAKRFASAVFVPAEMPPEKTRPWSNIKMN